jgi:small-conductance mechanosensitive channel
MANEQRQGPSGLSLPPHGNAAAGQDAAGRVQARAANSGAPAQTDNNNVNGPEAGMWAYFQHLEGSLKRLTDQLEAEVRNNAQLVEKLGIHDQHIAALTAEVAALRQQLAPPPLPQQQVQQSQQSQQPQQVEEVLPAEVAAVDQHHADVQQAVQQAVQAQVAQQDHGP